MTAEDMDYMAQVQLKNLRKTVKFVQLGNKKEKLANKGGPKKGWLVSPGKIWDSENTNPEAKGIAKGVKNRIQDAEKENRQKKN